jgi:GNAT superfamily N-acetyltransferase
MNTVFLSRPVATEADLRNRISFAKDYFEAEKRLWLFILFNEWLHPSIRPEHLFWDHRVAYVQGCFGMQATRLLEPARPAPELAYRLVRNDAERLEFSDINADSYGLLEEWRTDIAAWICQWPKSRIRLYIAYSGDIAVSSAMVHLIGDAAFLGFLATRQGHQGKGYAEAIVRYALARAQDDWYFSKTILHSTPASVSLYRRLGLSEVASFGIYVGGCEYEIAKATSI